MFKIGRAGYFTKYNNNNLHVKIIYLHTICHHSDMFRSVFIIFREFLNLNETYIKIQMDYLIR